MSGIGWNEIILIVIIGCIFFKPEDIPQLLKKTARFYNRTKSKINDLILKTEEEIGEK